MQWDQELATGMLKVLFAERSVVGDISQRLMCYSTGSELAIRRKKGNAMRCHWI